MRKWTLLAVILSVAYLAYRTGYLPKVSPAPHVSTSPQPGVAPISAWQCPATHPIKGNFTTYSGERCIYHVPGGAFYGKTKPERCYASADDARADGCRASKR